MSDEHRVKQQLEVEADATGQSQVCTITVDAVNILQSIIIY